MATETPVQVGKRVLALVAKHEPTAEVLVGAAYDHRTHTRFARKEITTSGDGDDWTLSLTVQLGLRSATATTNQLDPASLDKLVQRTIANAKLSPELPETMPVLGAMKVTPNDLHDPALASLDARARAEGIAVALEPSRSVDLLTAGYVEVHDGVIARVSSAGLEVSAPYTDSSFSVTARTKDGTGSGWNALGTRKRAELDFAKVGRIAAQKALASAKPKAIEPGRYTVVLEAAATADLMWYLVSALDRRSVDEGRSAFVGKVGSRVVNERLTLRSDPRSTPMFPFDAEGSPLAPRTWIDKGVLKELSVGRYWAQKQGIPSTGAYDGYELAPGDTAPDALVKGVKRGVLITRLWYSNFIDAKTLSITALTRDGTFLIEDGVVTQPIKNFRINQSVLAALDAADAVGNVSEVTWSSVWRVPSIRTHGFLLASASDAI
jgi:predicted Zn-dependent protease